VKEDGNELLIQKTEYCYSTYSDITRHLTGTSKFDVEDESTQNVLTLVNGEIEILSFPHGHDLFKNIPMNWPGMPCTLRRHRLAW